MLFDIDSLNKVNFDLLLQSCKQLILVFYDIYNFFLCQIMIYSFCFMRDLIQMKHGMKFN